MYISIHSSHCYTHTGQSLKWSIINGSLYANEDRVFPPSMSMQLHAPRREGPEKVLVGKEEVDVSYALEARPLSSRENGSTSQIVRVRVDLCDSEGEPVTPQAVVLDLLAHPDGTPRIARVRMEPGKRYGERPPHRDRPWTMKFWQIQMGAFFKNVEDRPISSLKHDSQPPSHDLEPSHPQPATDVASSTEPESQLGFISSPYWSPTTYSHHSHRHPHNRQPSGTFMRLVRPVILPAVLGAAAGLMACLLGFLIGHAFMSLSVLLGFRKPHRRSRTASIEDGTLSEKARFVSTIHLTEVKSMDA